MVDYGVAFPQEVELGIDLDPPDISYLRERAANVRAIFITHGHEDHIGALPYHLTEINAPVYATKLTLGLSGPNSKKQSWPPVPIYGSLIQRALGQFKLERSASNPFGFATAFRMLKTAMGWRRSFDYRSG